MPNPLPERTQRMVVIGLIAVLAGFGLYFSLGGFSSDEDGRTVPPGDPGATRGAAEPLSEPGGLATVPPSPIPTTGAEDLDVLGWLPFSEAEFQAAGATAQAFAEAYGTIDYSQEPETYYASMEVMATDEYAEVLSDANRAGAFWEEMSQAEAVAEGRAEVQKVRTFGSDSVTFVVTAQSITETGDAEFDEDLGDFAVTVVREGGSWAVFDFQPADVGQFGEE
ncbi:hypothetical protein GCM10007079_42360 [Nocardiopsis terrae]|uniref:Mce-associated membrane protein n=1 Tax=Nocardiopsis terrae TaxID=372655 RepID=A0ABR9HLS0_9ACTN|nr:hypothetical protein [Nocardiopsis terrae]MBE1459947.1 hypothetical protein [Nocardiopsis terrae]GHC93200.1 hypothetical protein GCM10007079_42360 [Nocardiopsis terrae]